MALDPTLPPVLEDGTLPLGGCVRVHPEDFAVDEIPLYPAAGEGEHLFVRVEKVGMTTPLLIRRVAKALGIPVREVGYAGQKDRHAVTRQWLSVPATKRGAVDLLDIPGVKVVEAVLHRNKLKLGHLRGNRFRILVRDAAPLGVLPIETLLRRFEAQGLPNGYGTQRFGTFRRNHFFGAAIVRGDGPGLLSLAGEPVPDENPRVAEGRRLLADGLYREALAVLHEAQGVERHLAHVLARGGDANAALRTLPRRDRDFLVSAWQSAAFNAVLARRLQDGRLLLDGDIAMKLPQGACFLVTDAAVEMERVHRKEIVATGPLPGTRTLQPAGEAQQLESEALAGFAIDPHSGGALSPRHFRGARRPLRVPLGEPSVQEVDPGNYLLEFSLPAGSFATALLAWFHITAPMTAAEEEG
jgi:tRNA pseudouridine13 synthase